MRRDPSEIRGSIVPIVTTFASDGEFDETTFVDLIEWQIESGSQGISVTGTTGEPTSLTTQERHYLVEVAAKTVGGRVPFVPGTGTNNLDETIAFTAHAERNGADAALVIVPYYSKPSQEGLFRYFRTVAKSTDLPVIIYNIPGRTATNMAPATMARLRRDCPNVVGTKESNKDFEHVSRVLHQCGRDFNVYSGIELLCYPMLAIGGAGHISATANIFPTEVANIYNYVVDGRWSDAIDLHFHLLEINEMIFFETNPGPLKFAMGELGRINPTLRPPLCEPSLENQARIRKVLANYGLLAQGDSQNGAQA